MDKKNPGDNFASAKKSSWAERWRPGINHFDPVFALHDCRRAAGKLATRIVSRRAVLHEAEADGQVLGLDVVRGTCHGFNHTAARVWQLLDRPRRTSELVDALLAEFDVDRDECERELGELLQAMVRRDLIDIRPASAPTGP